MQIAKTGGKEPDDLTIEPQSILAVIHSVTKPLDQITAAIHVYGGDFFAVPRSEWDPHTFEERPYDIEHAREVFERANKRIVSPELLGH